MQPTSRQLSLLLGKSFEYSSDASMYTIPTVTLEGQKTKNTKHINYMIVEASFFLFLFFKSI